MGGKVSRFGLGHFRRVLHLTVASDLVAEGVIGRQRCSRVVDISSWMSVELAGWESGVTRVEAVESAKISSRIETVPEVVRPLGMDGNSQNQKTSDLCVIVINTSHFIMYSQKNLGKLQIEVNLQWTSSSFRTKLGGKSC
jgi:hypothetical protein